MDGDQEGCCWRESYGMLTILFLDLGGGYANINCIHQITHLCFMHFSEGVLYLTYLKTITSGVNFY